jgi:sulfur-carrier protein
MTRLYVCVFQGGKMAVLVEIPHAISRYSDEETAVEIEGATVGKVLEVLWERFPNLKSRVLDRSGGFHPYLLLFQNDRKLSRSSFHDLPVRDGDRLEIVALAEGG